MKKSVSEVPDDIRQKLKDIGHAVKSKRKAIANNYQAFAKGKGLNSMTLWRIEHGENTSLVSFLEVLQALDIKVEDFFKVVE